LKGTVSRYESQFADVLPETADCVVILTVDVRGDRTAYGHVSGAGSDWYKPTAGGQHPNQVIETYARLDFDNATDRIEAQNPVKMRCIECQSTTYLGRIAVRTAQTARNYP